jgi:catechol 2,3-dioxygenase-like lactoylglutathione lyase family enzyme
VSIARLDHYTLRTTDLAGAKRFYVEVLGLADGPRPPFDFPGAWLYAGEGEAAVPVVHLVGIDPKAPSGLAAYLGETSRPAQAGTGPIDHIAFVATGWPDLRARCTALGVPYDQRTVPGLGLHQVFLHDPCGVRIELNYPAAEGG